MNAFVTAGAGFLMAVLWFDLMFDVQVIPARQGDELPEAVLASVAAYYARVTTAARPMNRLIAATMLGTLAAVIVELANGLHHPWVAWASLLLTAAAIGMAGARTVPGAVRLGGRRDTIQEQSALARAILAQHLFCFSCMATVLVLQLAAG